MNLLPLLPVTPNFLTWRGHRIAHYQAGTGRPVLLIHSINAAASAFEMRGPFDHLGEGFAIHAIDLLGYGNSDRPERRYWAEDYISQIELALETIGEPTAIIASSLGAAYAVAAAVRRPELVSALILACPVGMGKLTEPPGVLANGFYNALRGNAGEKLFERLTTMGSIGYFLRSDAYHNPASVTYLTQEAFYQACRRPGAHHAPICFLTRQLNCDIRTLFPRLTQPIMIIWGRYARTTPLRGADAFLAANPRTHLEVIDHAAMLVQDECPTDFSEICRTWLASV